MNSAQPLSDQQNSQPCRSKSKSVLPLTVNTAKGVAIGMANIIPGVSGGTIAVITGIYDDIVQGFGHFFSGPGGWRKNLCFLLPVLTGVLIGNIAFARIIGYLLHTAPFATRSGFMGLILGSLPYLVKHAAFGSFKLRYAVLVILGFAIVLGMGLAPEPEKSPPMTDVNLSTGAVILVSAFLASIAMVIPGVSGSFLLLLMGMYSTLQHAFSTLNVPVMSLFIAGTVGGVVIVSRIISALLRRFHSSTYSVITGLVAGSALMLFPGFTAGREMLVHVGAFFTGLCLSLFLGTGMKERILRSRKNT
jgi:putative membrane protein